MNLFGIDFTHQSSTGFSLSGAAARSANVAAQASEPAASATASLSSENMMASHFVQAGRKQSKYISGLMIGLNVQSQFANQMQSVVAGYRNVLALTSEVKSLQGEEMTNADLYLLGMKAAESVGDVVDGEVTEKNAEQAEEIRQDVEERAEEATASESEKVMEDETSPIEELEENLEEAAPSGSDGEAASQSGAAAQSASLDNAVSAVSPMNEAAVERAAVPGDAPAVASDGGGAPLSVRSVDIMV
ncbi:MAG: hypothetical protein V3571_13910 [Pseudodesulfovibrio sp.]